MDQKLKQVDLDSNDKIIKSESGIIESVFQSLQTQIHKFFKNYALEQFGASILEVDKEASLYCIFEKILESQLKKHKLDPKYQHNHIMSEIETQIMEQVNNETEEL